MNNFIRALYAQILLWKSFSGVLNNICPTMSSTEAKNIGPKFSTKLVPSLLSSVLIIVHIIVTSKESIAWMDIYWKEVLQVSTWKHGINFQYLYDTCPITSLGEIDAKLFAMCFNNVLCFKYRWRIWVALSVWKIFLYSCIYVSIFNLEYCPKFTSNKIQSNIK